MRWIALLLLVANVALFIWGWAGDRPLLEPLPELPETPGAIRLHGEAPPPPP